jgi:hypothetical protein
VRIQQSEHCFGKTGLISHTCPVYQLEGSGYRWAPSFGRRGRISPCRKEKSHMEDLGDKLHDTREITGWFGRLTFIITIHSLQWNPRTLLGGSMIPLYFSPIESMYPGYPLRHSKALFGRGCRCSCYAGVATSTRYWKKRSAVALNTSMSVK